MIRIHFKTLLDDKSFRERRRIALKEVSESTGLSRTTLHRIANEPGYGVSTLALNALCRYFGCTPCELLSYVEDEGEPARVTLRESK